MCDYGERGERAEMRKRRLERHYLLRHTEQRREEKHSMKKRRKKNKVTLNNIPKIKKERVVRMIQRKIPTTILIFKITEGKFPPDKIGKTRDVVARYVGISGQIRRNNEKEKAEERKLSGVKIDTPAGKFPAGEIGDTRDSVAGYVGISGRIGENNKKLN